MDWEVPFENEVPAVMCPTRICARRVRLDGFSEDPERVKKDNGHIIGDTFRTTISRRQGRKEVVYVGTLFRSPRNG
jgi:hypothetical protein